MINDKHGIPQPELTGTKAFHVECVRCFKPGTGGKAVEYYRDEKGNDDLSKPPKVVEPGEIVGYGIAVIDKDGMLITLVPNHVSVPFATPKAAWRFFEARQESLVKTYESDTRSELL